jgi:hypothetical protein
VDAEDSRRSQNKGVKGTFMMIGAEAQENVGLMKRVVREGHEIGNHTYTHPDISEISSRSSTSSCKLTERLFASKLGVQPLYFRPPYDIDEEPDTDDQAAPVERIQRDGYIIVGSKLDTNDWNEQPRKTPAEITQSILDQLEIMKTKPQFRGSIILLHDGGGDRSVTVAALPVLIDTLRAHGYTIVPVSALLGKTTAQVMPKLTFRQYLRALPDSIAFSSLAVIGKFIVLVFFVGDILMSARLLLVACWPSSTACAALTPWPRPASIPAWPCSFPPTTRKRSSCAPSARCSTPTTRTCTSSSSTTARATAPPRSPARPTPPRSPPAASRCSPSPTAARPPRSTSP